MKLSASGLFTGLALMMTLDVLAVVILVLLSTRAIREHLPADLYRFCNRVGVACVIVGSCGAVGFAWALGSHQF